MRTPRPARWRPRAAPNRPPGCDATAPEARHRWGRTSREARRSLFSSHDTASRTSSNPGNSDPTPRISSESPGSPSTPKPIVRSTATHAFGAAGGLIAGGAGRAAVSSARVRGVRPGTGVLGDHERRRPVHRHSHPGRLRAPPARRGGRGCAAAVRGGGAGRPRRRRSPSHRLWRRRSTLPRRGTPSSGAAGSARTASPDRCARLPARCRRPGRPWRGRRPARCRRTPAPSPQRCRRP